MSFKREGALFRDSKTMFIRSLMLSLRSPEAVSLGLIAPAALMVVFVFVIGGAMDFGDSSVVNFIVPGIILLSIAQSTPSIAARLTNDMSKGVIDRFRTMPIAKSSILVGHVSATVFNSVLSVAVTICVAFLVGFRPQAGLVEWLLALGILVLYIIMMMWLAVLVGVHAKEPDSATGIMMLIGILPFLSSGFAPTETMPTVLRVFAENQPMTPIINSVRALLLAEPLADSTLRLALAWCVGLTVVFYFAALGIYKRKTAK